MMEGQDPHSPPYVEPLTPRVEPLTPPVSPLLYPEQDALPLLLSDISDRQVSAGEVIVKIEGILESITDALRENRVLSIPMRTRPSGNEFSIRFPSNNEAEVKKFTGVLVILQMAHEALVSGTIVTKRNIYYQYPELFGKQSYVDKLVDDISFTLRVRRNDLNIVAAFKGLVAGSISIVLENGSTLDCSIDSNGTAVPQADSIHHFDIAATRWILVIEKEATFRSLASSRYYDCSQAGPGIIATAKGYPDLATRQFLHLLHTSFPHIPIYALVDFDPAGITIMRNYKIGSRSLGHEPRATVSGLSWLGLKSSDVLGRSNCTPLVKNHPYPTVSQSSGLLSDDPSPSSSSPIRSVSETVVFPEPAEAFSSLTDDDRGKAINILRNLAIGDTRSGDEAEIVRELHIMLMLNMKAEIQAVDDVGSIATWLDGRLLGASKEIGRRAYDSF